MVWLMVGGIVLLVGLAGRRPPLWHPRPALPSDPAGPLPAAFPADPDGCWFAGPAHLWFSPAGPLRDQGRGIVRCLGDQLVWLGPTGTITVPWAAILALHGHANGILIHAAGLPPLVISVADNAPWHRDLTVWLASTWVWDGQQWQPQ